MRAMVMGAVAAVTLAAGGASAATYTYEYVGNEFTCETANCDGFGVPGPFRSTFILNDASLPGDGTLDGTLIITASQQTNLVTTEFISPEGSFFDVGDVAPSFVTLTGEFADYIIPPVAYENSFGWVFEAGEIVSWGGTNYTGGSYDRGSSTGGDSYAFGATAPAGTWTLVSVVPSPIPLPASATLLGVALAGLGLMRRRIR